jgi:hypothetical protein
VNLFHQDTFDLIEGRLIEPKIERTADVVKLAGLPGTPQHGTDSRPIERPADRQIDRTLSETFARKTVQSFDGPQVLTETRLRKFRVDAPEIITDERRALVHAPA